MFCACLDAFLLTGVVMSYYMSNYELAGSSSQSGTFTLKTLISTGWFQPQNCPSSIFLHHSV